MRDVVPASATAVFKNERREPSGGIMVKTACLVEGTSGASGISGCEITIQQECTRATRSAASTRCYRMHARWHRLVCRTEAQGSRYVQPAQGMGQNVVDGCPSRA